MESSILKEINGLAERGVDLTWNTDEPKSVSLTARIDNKHVVTTKGISAADAARKAIPLLKELQDSLAVPAASHPLPVAQTRR